METAETKAYESPRIRAVGTLRDLTQGSKGGDSLDAAFPQNTLRRDLTFS